MTRKNPTTLTSSEMLARIGAKDSGTPPPPNKDEQLEFQLSAIDEVLGSLNQRTQEMQQQLGRMQRGIDGLEEKLDQALELIKQNGEGGHQHEEWPGGGAGWND